MEPTSWASREGLLLRAIIDRLDTEGPGVDSRRVANAIGMSYEDADRASRRLYDAKMLRAMTGDDRVMSVREVTEKGLQAAGEWPSDAELLADRILEVLAERAETSQSRRSGPGSRPPAEWVATCSSTSSALPSRG